MHRLLSMACVAMVAGITNMAVAGDAKELAKFDGTWALMSATLNGTVADPEECKLYLDTIKGGKAVTKYKGKDVATATYKLIDTTKTPTQIDLAVESGPAKGRMMKGIYKFDGNKLVTCFGGMGKDRPTAFESKKGSGTVLQTFEKQKADK